MLPLAGLLAICTAACGDRCNLDNAMPAAPPRRKVKLVIKDALTNESLIGAGRRYHPDSIFYSSKNSGGNSPEQAQADTAGLETAVAIRHFGTLSGTDCNGNPYPRQVGNVDSVFLHLDAADTDTLVVTAAGSGEILLYYNAQLVLTTHYADNAVRTIEGRK